MAAVVLVLASVSAFVFARPEPAPSVSREMCKQWKDEWELSGYVVVPENPDMVGKIWEASKGYEQHRSFLNEIRLLMRGETARRMHEAFCGPLK